MRRGSSKVLVVLGVFIAILATAPLAFGFADLFNIQIFCQNPDGSVGFSCSSTTTTPPGPTSSTTSSTAGSSSSSSSSSSTAASSSSSSTTASTSPPTLTAFIQANSLSAQAGQTMTFTGSASGGSPPYSYTWSFGDGTSAAGQSATHAFSATGAYTIILNVVDSAGSTGRYSLQVQVSPAPTPLYVVTVVSSFDGSAVSGATVTMTPTVGPASTGTPIGGGQYSFTGLAGGTYLLTTSASGYATNSVTVTVPSQGSGSYQVTLFFTACQHCRSALGFSSLELITGLNVPWFGEIFIALALYFVAGALVSVGRKK